MSSHLISRHQQMNLASPGEYGCSKTRAPVGCPGRPSVHTKKIGIWLVSIYFASTPLLVVGCCFSHPTRSARAAASFRSSLVRSSAILITLFVSLADHPSIRESSLLTPQQQRNFCLAPSR